MGFICYLAYMLISDYTHQTSPTIDFCQLKALATFDRGEID